MFHKKRTWSICIELLYFEVESQKCDLPWDRIESTNVNHVKDFREEIWAVSGLISRHQNKAISLSLLILNSLN